MKTIRFKSNNENWKKEYSGIKSNTLRKDTSEDYDIRFECLDEYLCGALNILFIEIENTSTKETFRREVTDVTIYDDYYIISW